jgi:2-desacetyl-2-hydroxyethyl bacteriochlorophyllide A dehydrogenase
MPRTSRLEVPHEVLEAGPVKAAVVVTPGTIEIRTVPDPAPGPAEVVVKPAAVGICGTDLHIMDGEFAPAFPIVPGHEFAGEIVAVGAAVTGYAVGDQVAVDPSLYCGHCYYCRRGRGNQCENWNAIGVSVTGGAAEYVSAPMANLFKLPPHLAATDAALIEPLSCAVRGFDVLPRTMADTFLIYGSGTMGLMMLELAKRAGAAGVSMVDLNPARLATAERLGCTAAVTSADELDAPRGWDVVIDCTGAEAAIRDGLGRVGRGGTFLQFGVSAYDTKVPIEPYEIYRREITVTGSMAVLHSFDRAGELMAAGVLDPEIFVSHRFPLDRYAEALQQFRAGIGRKILIEP